MPLFHSLVRKAARAQSLLSLKQRVGTRLRETYYNAEVLRRIEDKIAPLNIQIDPAAPLRVNLILPEIDFRTFYGGYIAKFNLAQRLTDFGYQVRFIIVDPCDIDEAAWRAGVAEYDGLENIFDRVEYVYCYDRKPAITVSPDDKLIATTWWTAYIAHAAAGQLGLEKFFYLIQEYEPFTFPMGSYYAIAHQSYQFPHRAFFSSPQLHDYFAQQKIGIFGAEWGDTSEARPFENAILAFDPSELPLQHSRSPRKLLFYARPEAHAARNMFEVAYLALSRAIEAGAFDGEAWEFHGIGSAHGDIPLPRGHTLKMIGKFGLKEYKRRLLDYDVGLSLMYTPHPSLLPLEMAAAGMLVVSNTCENKDAAELRGISSNLIGAEPTIEGVATALSEAVAGVGDIDARRQGAAVNWSSSWQQTFDDKTMQQIIAWL